MGDSGCIDPAREAGGRPRSTDMRQVVNAILYSAGKGTQWRALRRLDAGKRIKGRKRHIITDTLGLMLFELVHSADIQDCDAGSWSGQWDGSGDAADWQGTVKAWETSIESSTAWTCIARICIMI